VINNPKGKFGNKPFFSFFFDDLVFLSKNSAHKVDKLGRFCVMKACSIFVFDEVPCSIYISKEAPATFAKQIFNSSTAYCPKTK